MIGYRGRGAIQFEVGPSNHGPHPMSFMYPYQLEMMRNLLASKNTPVVVKRNKKRAKQKAQRIARKRTRANR